jgi:hypothetical protein
MKYVYIVTIEQTFDSEVFLSEVAAFETENDAQDVFHKHIIDFTTWMMENGKEWEVDEEESFFESWVEGDYNNNHYSIKISKVEIGKKQFV